MGMAAHAQNTEDDPNLISKRELLEATGISYGQLYRWKRKGLIPESWFLKKSAFTGQETFFPRREILQRVEQVQGMKDDLALADLADLLAPAPVNVQLDAELLVEKNIISRETIDLLSETCGPTDPLDFNTALKAWIVERLLREGNIGLEEARLALRTLGPRELPAGEPRGTFVLVRKRGIAFCAVVLGEARTFCDPECRVVASWDLITLSGELNLALKGDGK
jgi:hypothetical protein